MDVRLGQISQLTFQPELQKIKSAESSSVVIVGERIKIAIRSKSTADLTMRLCQTARQRQMLQDGSIAGQQVRCVYGSPQRCAVVFNVFYIALYTITTFSASVHEINVYCIGLPIHCNYQLAHYSGFCRISRSILNRFQPNLQAQQFAKKHVSVHFFELFQFKRFQSTAPPRLFLSRCACHGAANPSTASHQHNLA